MAKSILDTYLFEFSYFFKSISFKKRLFRYQVHKISFFSLSKKQISEDWAVLSENDSERDIPKIQDKVCVYVCVCVCMFVCVYARVCVC